MLSSIVLERLCKNISLISQNSSREALPECIQNFILGPTSIKENNHGTMVWC